jgi:hypothetical protein
MNKFPEKSQGVDRKTTSMSLFHLTRVKEATAFTGREEFRSADGSYVHNTRSGMLTSGRSDVHTSLRLLVWLPAGRCTPFPRSCCNRVGVATSQEVAGRNLTLYGALRQPKRLLARNTTP